jgi:hypothetical protein
MRARVLSVRHKGTAHRCTKIVHHTLDRLRPSRSLSNPAISPQAEVYLSVKDEYICQDTSARHDSEEAC